MSVVIFMNSLRFDSRPTPDNSWTFRLVHVNLIRNNKNDAQGAPEVAQGVKLNSEERFS